MHQLLNRNNWTLLFWYKRESKSAQATMNSGPIFFCPDPSQVRETFGYTGVLFQVTVAVPLPVFSRKMSQGKWKRQKSCWSYCKCEEANSSLRLLLLQQHTSASCSNYCSCKADKWGWQREKRGHARRCEKVPSSVTRLAFQECLFRSELVYFTHWFDWDKVFKGWNNIFLCLVQLWANCQHLNN